MKNLAKLLSILIVAFLIIGCTEKESIATPEEKAVVDAPKDKKPAEEPVAEEEKGAVDEREVAGDITDEEKELQIISFNTGLPFVFGQELVPCRNERLKIQPSEVAKVLKKPFILMLQEVFQKDAYDAYKKMAESNGYSITKTPVDKRGLVTISSGPFESDPKFDEFSCDLTLPIYKNERGLLSVPIKFGEGENSFTVQAYNTHTYYSEGEMPDPCHQIQLAEIVQTLSKSESTPTVFAGDINAGQDSSYKEQEYNPIEILWAPFLENIQTLGFVHVPLPDSQVTWDEVNNPLVSSPSPLIGEWKENSASIDHIFVNYDEGLQIPENSNLILNEMLDIPGCDINPNFLSDHYGIEAIISIEDPSDEHN